MCSVQRPLIQEHAAPASSPPLPLPREHGGFYPPSPETRRSPPRGNKLLPRARLLPGGSQVFATSEKQNVPLQGKGHLLEWSLGLPVCPLVNGREASRAQQPHLVLTPLFCTSSRCVPVPVPEYTSGSRGEVGRGGRALCEFAHSGWALLPCSGPSHVHSEKLSRQTVCPGH